jgi:hypothetical protein
MHISRRTWRRAASELQRMVGLPGKPPATTPCWDRQGSPACWMSPLCTTGPSRGPLHATQAGISRPSAQVHHQLGPPVIAWKMVGSWPLMPSFPEALALPVGRLVHPGSRCLPGSTMQTAMVDTCWKCWGHQDRRDGSTWMEKRLGDHWTVHLDLSEGFTEMKGDPPWRRELVSTGVVSLLLSTMVWDALPYHSLLSISETMQINPP